MGMVHYQQQQPQQPPQHPQMQMHPPPPQPQIPEQPYYQQQHQPYDPMMLAQSKGKKLPDVDAAPERERIEVIPMNLEKPTGLEMGDFLPMKFQMMGLGGNTLGGYDSSRFAGFKNFGAPNDLNEDEVRNSLLKGHEPMMAA